MTIWANARKIRTWPKKSDGPATNVKENVVRKGSVCVWKPLLKAKINSSPKDQWLGCQVRNCLYPKQA